MDWEGANQWRSPCSKISNFTSAAAHLYKEMIELLGYINKRDVKKTKDEHCVSWW